jgi:hypothetical protein
MTKYLHNNMSICIESMKRADVLKGIIDLDHGGDTMCMKALITR